MKAGLALQPQALQVSLVDRPLTDLLFTQFMASVSGKVYCLGKSYEAAWSPYNYDLVDQNTKDVFVFVMSALVCC